MNIHEYQSKEILKSYGVKVPNGMAAFSPEEAARIAKDLGTPVVVVKAQIHAGGRGKAGGVKLAHNIDEVKYYASELLGKVPFLKNLWRNKDLYAFVLMDVEQVVEEQILKNVHT